MEVLTAKRIILRSLTFDDEKKVEGYASDYDIAKMTLAIPHPYPKGEARKFIAAMLDAEKNGKAAFFAIVKKEDNCLIGLINIMINSNHGRGELGYWIGKPFWRKGYGTEAARLMLRYGFEVLKLNRIYAVAFTDNDGSRRILEKIGMKHEGIMRKHVMKWGKPMDITYFGIVKEEYQRM